MALSCTYPSVIPEKDLLGRVMGPDTAGGYLRVVRVEHEGERTRAYFRPVPPSDTHVTVDAHGQQWGSVA